MSLRERKEIQEMLRGVRPEGRPYQPQKPLKITGIQSAVVGDRKANIEHALKFANVALEKGSKIICFSELFTQPWFYGMNLKEQHKRAEPIPGPSTEPFMALTETSDVTILCPVFEYADDRYYNSVAVLEDGDIKGIYRKVQLPDTAFWEERDVFTPGDMGLPVFETKHARIGVQIGWDIFFPEAVRIMAMNGADIIFAPTAAALESHERWQSVIVSHAIVNNIFLFRINRAGQEGDLHFYGKSFCVDPFGEMVVEPVFDRESVIIAEIDLDVIPLARSEFPFFRERRTELYGRLVRD